MKPQPRSPHLTRIPSTVSVFNLRETAKYWHCRWKWTFAMLCLSVLCNAGVGVYLWLYR